MRFEHETLLADALFNVHTSSGASDEYSRGIVLGIVTTLMAVSGESFKDVVPILVNNLPISYRDDRLPEPFRADVRKEFQAEVDRRAESAKLQQNVKRVLEK